MLHRNEASNHSSECESESINVAGEGTPQSVGSKEEKIETVDNENEKRSGGKSIEIVIEESKPRASVLEYRNVSQMYVL